MKPAPFDYHRPTTLSEVTDLLSKHSHDAELMAGNQSLGIIMSNRLATPEHVIDLNRVDSLSGITISEDEVEIGAMTTHRTIECSDDLDAVVPILPEAAEGIAGPSVRNRGTIGGSVAEADPAGNYPTSLVALDATIRIVSDDAERTMPARDFFIGYMFTDIAAEELITGVSIPLDAFPAERTGMAFLEEKRAAQTFPTVSAGAVIRVDDPDADEPVVEDARIALGNVSEVPLHVPKAEAAVEGAPLSDETLDEAAGAVTDAVEPTDEMHADPQYKEELADEYARRSLRTAYDRITEHDGI